MKYIKLFEGFSEGEWEESILVLKAKGDWTGVLEPGDPKKAKMNESFWNMIFGKPTEKDAAGWSHTEKDEDNYIMYQGKKILPGRH